MPAIDFPAAPAVNDEYSFEGRTWRWNGTGWEVKEYPAALLAGTAANPSLYFSGDPNTGLYSPGADQVAVATNGTGRLFVDSAGNVGVGTTSPSANGLVTIAETTNARLYLTDSTLGNTYGAQLRGYGVGGNGGYAELGVVDANTYTKAITVSEQANSIIFSKGATERARIDSSGRLGIGTSSPIGLLQLKYATNVNTSFRNSSAAGLTAGTLVEAVNDGFSAFTPYYIRASEYGFGTDSGGTYVPRFTIDSSGRVGIGTTTPGYLFEASRGTAGDVAAFTASTDRLRPLVFSSSDNTASGAVWTRKIDSAFGIHAWSINSSERARIDSSGRLLVGTSSTSVAATILAQGNSSIGATGSGIIVLSRGEATPASGIALGEIRFADNTHTNSALIQAYRDDGTWSGSSKPTLLAFSTTADGVSAPTERMRITASGGLLLGTTTHRDNSRLVVDGDGSNANSTWYAPTSASYSVLYFRNTNGNVGRIDLSGTSTSYITTSDYRVKQDIASIENGIYRLKQLKPSRFSFVAEPNKTVDGFIAHEVQEVVPESISGEKDAVDDEGNPVYQGIDQSKLVPLLTAALQEAIGEIESLKARVVALESA